MKRYLGAIAALCLIAVGACSTLESAAGITVTQTQVDAAKSTYGVFASGVIAYRQLAVCSATVTAPCKTVSAVKQLQADDSAIYSELQTVQAMVTAGNNTGLVAAYNLLMSSLATGNQLLANAKGA